VSCSERERGGGETTPSSRKMLRNPNNP
jgi:hypothetical protein